MADYIMGDNEIIYGDDISGDSGTVATATATFDGKITAWPEDKALSITNIPTDEKQFIVYLACEIYKNQNITNPKQQAIDSINYAKAMYNVLSRYGYL